MANSASPRQEDKSNAASGQQTTMDQADNKAAFNAVVQQVMSLQATHFATLSKRSIGSTIRLNGASNWTAWKTEFNGTLNMLGLRPMRKILETKVNIDNYIKKTHSDNKNNDRIQISGSETHTLGEIKQAWRTASSYLWGLLVTSISPSLNEDASNIVSEDPQLLWSTLQQRFEPKTQTTGFDVLEQYNSFIMDSGESIQDLRRRFSTIVTKLRAHDFEHPDRQHIYMVFKALPAEYEIITTTMTQEMNYRDLTLADVWTRLIEREKRFTKNKKGKVFNTRTETKRNSICRRFINGNCRFGQRCYYKHVNNNSNNNINNHNYNNNNNKGNNNRGNKQCDFCNRRGHTQSECRLYKTLYKQVKAEVSQDARASNNSTRATVHHAAVRSAALHTAITTRGNTPSPWLVDSGATHHLTPSADNLKNVRSSKITLEMPDGTVHHLHETGDLTLYTTAIDPCTGATSTQQLELTDVLVAPMLTKNVISTPTLDDHKCKLVQEHSKMEIYDVNRAHKGTARKWNSLFHLQASRTASVNSLNLWHRRLGHLSELHLRKTPQVSFKTTDKLNTCEDCLIGKMPKRRIPKQARHKSSIPGERLHIDVQGPFNTSRNGAKYIMTITDDATNRVWVRLLSKKSRAILGLKFVINEIKNEGKHVRKIRLDNAGEHVAVEDHCQQEGISTEYTNPYSSHQNGKAARMNRTIIEMANTMLHASGLPRFLWGSAALHAEYVLNRSYCSVVDTTPYEAWYKQQPDISHLRVFGSRAFIKILRNKGFKPRAQEGFLVSMDSGPRNYEFWIPKSNKIVSSADAVIQEDLTYHDYKKKNQDRSSDQEDNVPALRLPLQQAQEEEKHGASLPASDSQEEEEQEQEAPLVDDTDHKEDNDEEEDDDDEDTGEEEEEKQAPPRRQSSRANAGIPAPRLISDPSFGNSSASFSSIIASAHNIITDEPKTFQDAINSPDSKQWQEAMDQEMKILQDKKTWTLTELPRGRTAIKGRWIYKLKYRPDGTISRHKARFVACGYTQRKGIDYHETFATVSKMKTVRTLEAVAAHLGLFIQDFDVKGAYLHGQLEEEIYMVQPQGYVSDTQPNYVCKLNKALYGLKQSARQWNQELRTTLTKSGYIPTGVDTNLFVCKRGNTLTLVPVWVDDMRAASNSKQGLGQLTCVLKDKYVINDNDESNWFIGLHTTRTPTWTKLDQQLLISKILAKFNMTNCNPAPTPSVTKMQLTQATDTEHKEMANVPFRQLLGSVLYVAVTSRPDVMTAVAAIARHCNKPSRTHWQALKRVLRYLKGTQHHGITYLRASCSTEPLQLQGYCDATWADNFETGRSTTGYFFSLAGGAISWSSKLQTTVAKSSAEAEYMAVDAAACEAIWLRQLLKAMHQPQREATPICIDNQAAIAMAKYDKFHNRSKHINVKYHYIRELLEHKQVTLPWVSTHDNPADLLTKSLAKTKFIKFRDKILGEDSATSSPDSSLRRSVGRALPVK